MKKGIFNRKFFAQILNREILADEKIKELNENDPLESLKSNTEKIDEIKFGNEQENSNIDRDLKDQNLIDQNNLKKNQENNSHLIADEKAQNSLLQAKKELNIDKESMADIELNNLIPDHLSKHDNENNINENNIKLGDKEASGPIKVLDKIEFLNSMNLLDEIAKDPDLNNDFSSKKDINQGPFEGKNFKREKFKKNEIEISEKNNINKKDIRKSEKSQINLLEHGLINLINNQKSEYLDKQNVKQQNIIKNKEDIHYEGHRKRLRDKILENGPTILKDYELLEIILTYSIPRADTKPLAKNLLAHFKSLQNIFLSDKSKLSKIKGLGESSICFLSVIHEITCRMAKEEIIDQVLLNTPEKVINYCRLRMSGLSYEQFYVLFLNRKNKLILDEPIQSGTIDKAAIFPRELVKRAIDLGAGAMILIHNHPSGDPTPSKADIETTINIQKAANLMEIFLYDHIIIGKNTHYSMRSNKIL